MTSGEDITVAKADRACGGALPLLAVKQLTKSWGPTRALSGVSFALRDGEILAIVGENGAGKSTLLNILSGVVKPDGGEIALEGSMASFPSPHEAQRNGIGTVFQELSLAKNLSVMENIFAGRLPSRLGLVDYRHLRDKTRALFASLGLAIDADAIVGELPVSSQQVVEIAKAVSLNARILLLDEPTSALNADEKKALFALVRSLKASGVGIIYISHHLDEVLDLSDRIVVLRDGMLVSVEDSRHCDARTLVQGMTGREIGDRLENRLPPRAERLLDIRQLSDGNAVHDLSFSIQQGEIVGLAGLMGSGRGTLAGMLAGEVPHASGTMELKGKRVTPRGMTDAKRLGIGYIPPERKTQGLFLDLSVAANIAAATLARKSRRGLADEAAITRSAASYVERLKIKAAGVSATCRSLSGGNQQKVLLAKWLELDPTLLIIEEPTKGVDIGAKEDIHKELIKLAAAGTGILLVSSDLPEILSLAHRTLVMHRGRIVADLDCRQTTEHEIVAHASGLPETVNGA